MSRNLFEDTVAICEKYLGPAARRFMTRQIAFHLDKDPVDLKVEDLPKLVEWASVTLALLTDDKQEVDEFADRILGLAQHAGH